MATIQKTVSNEIKKWSLFNNRIIVLNNLISHYHYEISFGDYYFKKKAFIKLHYLRMLRDYIYLKIYHSNIKKINEKLLCYYESILVANGIDLEKW